MLQIHITERELFDEATSEFILIPEAKLDLEHSLLSLSKWESKFQRPFLGKDEKTPEELDSYIESMCLTPLEDPTVLEGLTADHYVDVHAYLQSPQSATTFGELPERPGGPKEVITAELIYYWLIAFNIPWEVEAWHLNRLFDLVRICNIKNEQANNKGKKRNVNTAEAAQQRAALNKQRREQLGSSG